jgi:hypothetical protein
MEKRLERMERALRSVREKLAALADALDEFEDDLKEPSTYAATAHISVVARPLD